MNQSDGGIFGGDIAVVATNAADEILNLAGGFNAGVAAADHHEGQEPTPQFGINDQVGLLHAADDGGAEFHGVTDRAHQVSVLSHAGDAAQIHAGAGGDEELFESDGDFGGVLASGQGQDPLGQVNIGDLALEDLSPAADHADGIDHVLRGEGAPGDFRQHGLENHVVFVGDYADAGIG